MRTTKKILTYVLSFILTVAILAYIVVMILSSTIMRKSYVISKLKGIHYYDEVSTLVESNFERYIQQSGLDEDVIKDIVTDEKIEKDTKQILSNLYDGLNEEISTDEIAENLNANIMKSLHGRTLTKNEEEAINKFIDKICNEYKATILHTKYESNIYGYYHKIAKFTKLFTQISGITGAVSLIALILLNIKHIYRATIGIGMSLLASGTIFIFANLYVKAKTNISTITILNNAFSTLLRQVLADILANMGKYGLISVISGVALIIVSNLIHNIRKYGLKEKN